LRKAGAEANGKAPRELYALTDQGLAYLLSQVSPRQVLEDLVRVLESREAQLAQLQETARQTRSGLEALRAVAEAVLNQVRAGPPPGANGRAPPAPPALPAPPAAPDWTPAALSHLAEREASAPPEDCPLPDLFRRLRAGFPGLTLGQFHDGLRRLHDEGR